MNARHHNAQKDATRRQVRGPRPAPTRVEPPDATSEERLPSTDGPSERAKLIAQGRLRPAEEVVPAQRPAPEGAVVLRIGGERRRRWTQDDLGVLGVDAGAGILGRRPEREAR
jgi:hypothetical protein